MCIRDSPLPLAEGEVVCGPLSETAHPDGLEGFVGPMRDLLGAQPQVRRAEGDAFGPSNLGLGPEEVAHRTHEALESVGMGGFGERAAHHLSFGQRKRVATATVLSMRPDILVLDEPSSNLDPRSRRHLGEILAALPVTKIIVTHDLPYAYHTCERAVILSGGRVAADGPIGAILSDSGLLAAHDLELPQGFAPPAAKGESSGTG